MSATPDESGNRTRVALWLADASNPSSGSSPRA